MGDRHATSTFLGRPYSVGGFRAVLAAAASAMLLGSCVGASSPAAVSSSAAPLESVSSGGVPTPTAIGVPSPSPQPTLALPGHGAIAFDEALDPAGNTSVIAIVEPDGTRYRRLTTTEFGKSGDASWSPRSGLLYFDVDTGPSSHIFVFPSLVATPVQLTSGSYHDFDPSGSPDGAYLAFDRATTGPASIMLAKLSQGGMPSQAASALTMPPAGSTNGDLYPDWSPDGRQIVFERDGAIEIVDVASRVVREVLPASVQAHRPKWSLDGNWILFGHPNDATVPETVDLVRPDGTGLTSLTSASVNSSAPAWSPDGTEIVFVQQEPLDHYVALWVMTAAGGEPTMVWHPAPGTNDFPGHPSWGATP